MIFGVSGVKGMAGAYTKVFPVFSSYSSSIRCRFFFFGLVS
jgi:hypothetical protein